MQSKIAHAAERKAFGAVLDKIIDTASSDDRDQNIGKLVDMASKLLKDTAPGAARGLKAGLYPGSKWEQFLFDVIDNTDRTVLKTAILNGAYESAFRGLRTTTQNAEKYQCNVPWIILFDPTSACNKHCNGCWAAEYGNKYNLSLEDMDKLVTEGSELGCHLYMLTGGEPLVRKHDIIKLAEKHQDCIFNIFTNASLIDDDFCDDVRRVANIVFSISVEGFEESNDGRRGDGSFNEAMAAMDKLRAHKLLFGTSTAYTKLNYKDVTSDEYYDLLISKGCRFAWYFHLMPVGKGAAPDLMCTPEQREYMFHRIREVRGITGGKQIFAMDFQNDGEYVGGCIAGGRVYCHINARGDVEPCVFIHYSNANIHDKSLIECFQQPIFQAYRKHWPWTDNLLEPCPMLENPEILPQIVHEADAPNTDYAAPESVEELCDKTTPYAKAWKPVADQLWLDEHPTGKKIYADEMSQMDVNVKAKKLAEDDAEQDAVTD
ncbi:MAG: radical SAM protein [Atopobiaceae bacterium]|jgi:MoaA/NifB/PqqE/SkfB family radical SAM enzyme|nr:radical SAM protein [Atopobiaceae bacterium]MCH4181113.1 radical SAM protein [Atopobiaceae bacterium]MCH4214088.1 radical SAM protein [Atopobiaceae bacterium]MCH4229551.1 radical SAM protein [Atopobiaceae bacterium]MCH4276440.1 radical SAM protein [Atopobiaceae bacterium]